MAGTETPRVREGFWRLTLFSLAGPFLWALHFGALYGVQHTACLATGVARDGGGITVYIAVATAAFLVPLLALVFKPRLVARLFRARFADEALERFLLSAARFMAGLSAFGVLGAGLAPFFLRDCPPLG
ncbi:hypothetical protein [Parvularcula dongshanensis]|uniref:Uncharacterized protein n=1 Tax=Parvularcula dongshanensis TaxID=1173995 RepID=A0A840I5I2_9PROT|nr:hypothetical protein [Parvularcula dongshanensis]MBB4659652.1 hypothetical protein [Parvularcula dongshanensis]